MNRQEIRIKEYRHSQTRFLLIKLPSAMDSSKAIVSVKETVRSILTAPDKPTHVGINVERVETYDESLIRLLDTLYAFANFYHVQLRVFACPDSLLVKLRNARKMYLVVRFDS